MSAAKNNSNLDFKGLVCVKIQVFLQYLMIYGDSFIIIKHERWTYTYVERRD